MKIDWKNLNKVRIHNKSETIKHFMIKAMVLKLLFNSGYQVYTECQIGEKVCDVLAIHNKAIPTVVEIETNRKTTHVKDLVNFYNERDMNLYVIFAKEVPDDLCEMEEYLKKVLGL